MKNIIYVGCLFFTLHLNLYADNKCKVDGSFTQGTITTEFVWENVVVSENLFSADVSDTYGKSKILGKCSDDGLSCNFEKKYISGSSKGNVFYYYGKSSSKDDPTLRGNWGYKKGDKSGGNFIAKVSCENSEPAQQKQCGVEGSFTQGPNTTEFIWSNIVFNQDSSFTGDSSDEYGNSKIYGKCNTEGTLCNFEKKYISGSSEGSTFYYMGKSPNKDDTTLKGVWGYRKGDKSGGNFIAKIVCK